MKKILLLFIFHFSFFTFNCTAQQWFTLNNGFDGAGQYDRINTLCTDTIHNILWAGGRFTSTFLGETVNNISYWDGGTWHPFYRHSGSAIVIGYGVSNSTEIATMIQFDSMIAIGVNSLIGNSSGVWFQNMEDSTAIALGDFNDDVKALCIYHDTLYAGGRFTQFDNPNFPYNTNATYGIAKWTGSEFVQVGGGIGGYVNAMCVYNDKLIAAGAFENAGGLTCMNIAQWDGTSWAPIGFGIGQQSAFDVNLFSVCAYNGKLYAGGLMDNGNDLKVWNGNNWSSVPNTFIDVSAMSVFKNKLYVGGGDTYLNWPWSFVA
ncbi:MAG: hypothetical protein WCI97_10930, partial [Bacteroidota bacterium]